MQFLAKRSHFLRWEGHHPGGASECFANRHRPSFINRLASLLVFQRDDYTFVELERQVFYLESVQ